MELLVFAFWWHRDSSNIRGSVSQAGCFSIALVWLVLLWSGPLVWFEFVQCGVVVFAFW